MKEQLLKQSLTSEENTLLNSLKQACKKIAPVWPLENFVAVNPYLGFTEQKFETTAQLLAKAGGIQMTLPLSFYADKIKEGKIKQEDLKAALSKKAYSSSTEEFLNHLNKSNNEVDSEVKINTLIDVASKCTEKDWNRFMTSRVSAWAASYFDKGQASWVAADQKMGIFAAWKAEAEVDRSPDISGLKGFRNAVKSLPNNPIEAAKEALNLLEVPEKELDLYLHRLLIKLGGWAAYAARLDWDSKLYGGEDGALVEFLAVLICWEACLFTSLDSSKLWNNWMDAKQGLSGNKSKSTSQHLAQKLILQDAFDLATQREIIENFKSGKGAEKSIAPKSKAQAVFCIDVRSEVFRRNLELVDQSIETLGFAGFFAFPVNFIPLAHQTGEAQCPVLIKTGPTIMEEIPDQALNKLAFQRRVLKRQAQQVWKSFKSGAVTCFSFVSPIGISFLPKLFTDSFGLTRPVPHPDKTGMNDNLSKGKSISLEESLHEGKVTGIPLEQRVEMARNALNAMSLNENFAPLVMLVGHGSSTVNNPHATGLDCGACGGRTGEANAKVAAAVLNDSAVRKLLLAENISIPESTIFLACLHDTTTDEMSIYNEQEVPESRLSELEELKKSLREAGQASRTERALRMSVEGNSDQAIKARSKDWSQVRPELGLAGCSSFVVAPRERTKNLNFNGRSFLHSYEWEKDKGFAILELIMTAPMVVTSWINLQYYASAVDNKVYGSGNKTLHNVTAGVGVLEGYTGDLRVGLPMQSVHDGENFQHEPVKLSTIIEAPIEAINDILRKHPTVKNLFDNDWMHLLVMDAQGQVSHRYDKDLNWKEI